MTPKTKEKPVNAPNPEKSIFKGKYYYGTGSRKTSIARVRIFSGSGKIMINNNLVENKNQLFLDPFVKTGNVNKFDISVKIVGGGINSREDAIRHGISRALVEYDSKLKQTLRKEGFLTRDPREKERKKPGLKRARRAPQWQKR